MESASDDEGEPAAALPRVIFLASLLLFCYQPQSRSRGSATRPLLVAAQTLPAHKKAVKPRSHRKKLYLTFDDGPNKGTHNVYRIVTDEQVPVSFFLVGEHVFDTHWQRALFDSLQASPYVALCNHSFSHANGRYERYYQRPDSVVADFRRTADSLGLDNAIARTPGRNCWRIDSLRATDLKATAPAADSLQGAGFALMGWDAEWTFDHKTFNVQQDAQTLLRQLDSVYARGRMKRAGHLVLLAHDQAFVQSKDSLELRRFLQALKQKGDWELVLATEYPGTRDNDY